MFFLSGLLSLKRVVKFLLALCLFLLLWGVPSYADPLMMAKVSRVVDGDTVKVEGLESSIRLAYIDARESRQPGGESDTLTLHQLVNKAQMGGKSITVDIVDFDWRYKRMVGELFDSGGNSLNLEMVALGHAYPYEAYLPQERAAAYLAARDGARAAKFGLWGEPGRITPSDWRRGERAYPIDQELGDSVTIETPPGNNNDLTPVREAYEGTCECPYDLTSSGRKCGKSSAYSRGGGETPQCYVR